MERKLRPSLRALVVVSFACLGLAALAAREYATAGWLALILVVFGQLVRRSQNRIVGTA